jgi:DnaK suppressor protein
MDRRKLRLIDAALERLDKGESGICEDCGESIPEKRLKVVPWAGYCVSCQERVDGRDQTERDAALEMIA